MKNASPLERERDDSTGTAAALLGIATIRYSFAEYATALTTYREALAIQERLDDAGRDRDDAHQHGERAVSPG